jgi:hypothetical protein
MIGPYAMLAAGISLTLLITGAYLKGKGDGIEQQQGTEAREELLVKKGIEAGQKGAAEAIAKIELKQVTIRQRVETEIREKPVYRDCQHSADVLRDINAALTGDEHQPAGGGELPAVSPAD